MLIGCAMVGCSDDDQSGNGGEGGAESSTTAEQSSSSTGPDPYAHCDKGVIEDDFVQDLQWSGPGVDQMTGEIMPGTYRIAATYLPVKPGKLDRVFELSGPVFNTLFGTQGFVAVATAQSESCSSLRTFTVWQSEEDMYALVGSEAHTAAMSETADLSRGGTGAISWDGDETTITWEEAASRLGAGP
jgi:hypothetical protein